ncbi:MAG: M23 family metallopeptidase [Cyclobacteriaceae bacterium]
MKSLFILFALTCTCISAFAMHEPDVYHKKSEDGAYLFYVDNNSYSPYQVEISFTTIENLEVSVDLPYFFVVEPGETQKFLFKAIPTRQGTMRFKYAFSFLRGDPSASGPDDYVYLFPFEHGQKKRIDQGYFGKFSHASLYALDFHMKEGEAVYAARAGVVVETREDSNLGGPDPSYEPHGNKVIVLHEDGTFGEYGHLQQHGVLVEEGDQVSAGQFIARSGNTGFSSGPHLHFMVYRADKLQYATVPVRFMDHTGDAVEARQGKYYYALHPGKAAFTVPAGGEVTKRKDNTEVSGNEFTIKAEQVDGTILLYAENGKGRAVNGVLNLQLDNLKSTEKLPYRFRVPAKTRQFVLKLTPVDPTKSVGYKMSYEF